MKVTWWLQEVSISNNYVTVAWNYLGSGRPLVLGLVLALPPSRRAFASSTQFGKGLQGRGIDVRRSLGTALLSLGAVGCTTGEG